jgi:hypothetical protein
LRPPEAEPALLPQHEALIDSLKAVPGAGFSARFAGILAGVQAEAAALFEAGAEALGEEGLAALARDFHPVVAASAREAEGLRLRAAAPPPAGPGDAG